jgi:hypothetical protein
VLSAALDVPAAVTPEVLVKTAFRQPTMRAIIVDGVEIHACVIATRETVQREPDLAR